MSVPRCSRKSRARLEFCSGAKLLRLAFLVPPPDYHLDWAWTFDPQADAVRQMGATVDPVDWTSDADFAAYDLVLPLIAWGYHQHFAKWQALLDRFERDAVRVANPVPVLRWNGDKSYLAELHRQGRRDRSFPRVRNDRRSPRSRKPASVFGSAELVDKAARLGERLRHLPDRPGRPASRAGPRLADARAAVAQG